MNIELLTKVMNKLKRMRHVEHFDMRTFVVETECGTAACIGGHGLMLAGYRPSSDPDSEAQFIAPSGRKVKGWLAAKREFGLTEGQANRLFFEFCWPQAFRVFGVSKGLPKNAAARIEHFIKTKGRE